jgi:hypothetical protein
VDLFFGYLASFGVTKPCVCDNCNQILVSMQGACYVRQALPAIETLAQRPLSKLTNTLGVYSGKAVDDDCV